MKYGSVIFSHIEIYEHVFSILDVCLGWLDVRICFEVQNTQFHTTGITSGGAVGPPTDK